MRRMTAELGPGYRPLSILLGSPVRAVLNAGGNTVYPHAFGGAGLLRNGDVLLGYGHSDVGGYIALQGRTLFLGAPDERCRGALSVIRKRSSKLTFEALRPNRRLSEIEEEISGVYGELGVMQWKRHHSAHGLGLQMHEPPFVDLGDHREVLPGMVFALMPALYVPASAALRSPTRSR